MSRIEKLTPEQEAYLPIFREKYLQKGLCTEQANFDLAFDAIDRAYAQIGKSAPKFRWRVDSPEMASIYISLWPDLIVYLKEIFKLANLGDNLGANLEANLWANLWVNLGANLRDNLGANLGANLGDNLKKITPQYSWFWGQQDSYWISFYKFGEYISVKYSDKDIERLKIFEDLADSCMWWYPFENVVFVCNRPEQINKDESGRLHNVAGPSVRMRDGISCWHVHGVSVPSDIILDRTKITIDRIKSEQNAEVRRVMLEFYGYEKYLIDSKAKVLDESVWGKLFKEELPDDEPIVMVQVLNSTPEPDGTIKRYMLRVQPDLRPMLADGSLGKPQKMTALNAIASTFGLRGEEYCPVFES